MHFFLNLITTEFIDECMKTDVNNVRLGEDVAGYTI